MHLVELRELLNSSLQSIYSKPRTELESILTKLNVAIAASAPTKSELLRESVSCVPDGDVISTAVKLLGLQVLQCEARTALEDALWEFAEVPQIHGRLRREIGAALDGHAFHLDSEGFNFLLWSLFCISPYSPSHFMFAADTSIAKELYQHVHQNPDDWNFSVLFAEIGALQCSAQRFSLLIEGLASSRVRPDVRSQLSFVAATNTALHPHGFEMRQVAEDDGYPVFKLVSRQTALGKPKNVVFASQVKPDIVLIDAVSNNIEVRTNQDKVLIYDRPIGAAGLTWGALQQWWCERTGEADDIRSRRALYKRLSESLPTNSPPQLNFLKAYYAVYSDLYPHIPALLPEVWLHWDPKTVAERGVLALTNFRMDFLALFPGGVRVVVEVDGVQHYSDADGKASPAIYAKNVSGDRDLKLAGYDVYRFGGAELRTEIAASVMVRSLFDKLFQRHGITYRKE
jgi:hypothetical protein